MIISQSAYTEFKLGCVKELVQASLNIIRPINMSLIPVNFLSTYLDLRTAMIKYKSNFVGTEFTELASTPASADAPEATNPVLPSSSAPLEGPIHNVSHPSSESVPGPSFTATNKRKRLTRKKPNSQVVRGPVVAKGPVVATLSYQS